MTQQEAYQKLRGLIERLNELDGEATALAKEYDLVYVVRERDGMPETLDPSWLDPSKKYPTFKKPLPEDALLAMHEDWCGCNKGLDCPDIEDVKEYRAGQDIYNGWVPSQFC